MSRFPVRGPSLTLACLAILLAVGCGDRAANSSGSGAIGGLGGAEAPNGGSGNLTGGGGGALANGGSALTLGGAEAGGEESGGEGGVSTVMAGSSSGGEGGAEGPALAPAGTNLLLDGDGESGRCTADWNAVSTVPGWTVQQGNPAVVCHSIGSFGLPATPPAGSAFLANGPYGDSTLSQLVDVSSAATLIDAGGVTLSLSGWLGGWGDTAGQALVSATPLDDSGQPLGAGVQLSGVNAATRANANAFLARSAVGDVPAGARTIAVVVKFVDTAGSFNVGYADNLSLTLSTPVAPPSLKAPVSAVPAFDHVFLVMMENTNYDAIVGRATAPFVNSLITAGMLLTNAAGVYHPSDQNYLAIAGGDTFVKGGIYFPDIHLDARNIADELETRGKTWKAYEQGMVTPCNTVKSGNYWPDDAPFVNFTNIVSNAQRCVAHLFDTTQLSTDLETAATTPRFSWIAADDYYDGEGSGNGTPMSVSVQDGWLQETLQPLLSSPAWSSERSLLILTWDESASLDTNHVVTVLLGSQGLVRAGAASAVSYNHYSIARTIESALGLSPLTANDEYAVPINDAFAP